jgi:hypothetical protein
MGCKGSRVRIPPRRPFIPNEINGLQLCSCNPFFFGGFFVEIAPLIAPLFKFAGQQII